MKPYVLSRSAARDLDGIWSYIAQDSTTNAELWLEKLDAACCFIGQNPHLGHTNADLGSLPLLVWNVGDYLIVYRPTSPRVQVIGITHGARHLASFVRGRVASS